MAVMLATAALGALTLATADPLACQPNNDFPMLPIYHLMGNVTKSAADGSIKLDPINGASGVTYKEGIYHVWHQSPKGWGHVISKDLIHWQRLPSLQLAGLAAGGSISMLDNADPKGPVIIYREPSRHLAVARLDDPSDKYLMKWSRAASNPVTSAGGPGAGEGVIAGPIWKQDDDHWTFKGTEKVMDAVGGGRGANGQWMVPVPSAVNGKQPPSGAGAPNVLISIGGEGDGRVFATWDNATASLIPWSTPSGAPKTGQEAHLEAAYASRFGASGGTDNNGRMMMLGLATPDFHGDAGKGITDLTRVTGIREVNYDHNSGNLVANPLPELKALRTGSIASEKAVALSSAPHVVKGTGGGAAASSDIEMTIKGFKSLNSGDTIDVCVLGSATNSSTGLGMKITVGDAGKAATTFGACGPTGPGGGHRVEEVDLGPDVITVRIMPDRSVADFFVNGGQVAGTVPWLHATPRPGSDSDITVSSSGPGVTADVDVFGMGCGWLTPSFTDSPTIGRRV